MELTQALFDDAMERAAENGYDMSKWPAERIAQDLMDCDSDWENADFAEVVYMAEDWKRRHP